MHMGQGAGEALTSALAVCLRLSPSLSLSPSLHTDASSSDTAAICHSAEILFTTGVKIMIYFLDKGTQTMVSFIYHYFII